MYHPANSMEKLALLAERRSSPDQITPQHDDAATNQDDLLVLTRQNRSGPGSGMMDEFS